MAHLVDDALVINYEMLKLFRMKPSDFFDILLASESDGQT